MPLVSTKQDLVFVMKKEDFGSPTLFVNYNDGDYRVMAGKWIEVTPSLLLTAERKLFIDESNVTYNIPSINQAIRLIIRPLVITIRFSYSNMQFMSSVIMGADSMNYWFCPKSKLLYNYEEDKKRRMVIGKTEDISNNNFKTALGSIPTKYITTTTYLSGKFSANQPHIEHLNSGAYSIYNNVRCATITTKTVNEINWDNITNGFIMNCNYNNPIIDPDYSHAWTFSYGLFTLSLKYIEDIVDLASSYLSYGVPYTRYTVLALSGNPSTRYNGSSYVQTDNDGVTAFEFFLAPVGEVT